MKAEIALALMRSVSYQETEKRGLTAADVLALPAGELASLGGYGSADEAEAARSQALMRAEAEIEFARKNDIRLLTPLSPDYPVRLIDSANHPRLLSVYGTLENYPRALAVVGTRKPTPYGRQSARDIVTQLATLTSQVAIVSGLAYGIDSAAHEAALDAGLPTVAVVGHGLSMIYPAANRQLAVRIVRSGGAIITEYLHDEAPFRSHFLARNAIIAKFSDATLVVESALKGGAMGTAAHAYNAGRQVFALPGRATDAASQGCNHLIRLNRAALVSSAGELIESMGWPKKEATKPAASQPSLFAEGACSTLAQILRSSPSPLTIDELTRASGLPVHQVMSEISSMEFEGLITRWPGSRFSLR